MVTGAYIFYASDPCVTILFFLNTLFVRPMEAPFLLPKSNMEPSLANCGGAGMLSNFLSAATGVAGDTFVLSAIVQCMTREPLRSFNWALPSEMAAVAPITGNRLEFNNSTAPWNRGALLAAY